MKGSLLAAAVLAVFSCALFAQTAPEAKQAVPAEKPAASSEKQAAPVVKVEKIVTAAAVENKEPVNPAASFDKTAGKVYTWTKVTADVTPAKIKHVYYLDGKKAAEVELAVNGSPYRVWSAKTVRPGSWKVEVTDDNGAVLSSAEFTVTNEAPADETEKPAATGK